MLANLYTAVSTGRANGGIFVTTGRFSRDAELRAPQLGIELIDDTLLLTVLNRAVQVALFPELVA